MDDPLKEVAKSVPALVNKVYDDSLSSMAKELGHIGVDIVKTVRLALAPLQYSAMLQERLARRLKDSVESVPREKLTLPNPATLNSALEGLKFQDEGVLAEAYAKLLSSAFNRDLVTRVHPAFPTLLQQLAPDELIVLFKVTSKERLDQRFPETMVVVALEDRRSTTTRVVMNHLERPLSQASKLNQEGHPGEYRATQELETARKHLLELEVLAQPDLIDAHVNHLVALGVLYAPQSVAWAQGLYSYGSRRVILQALRLTSLGQQFAHTCIPDRLLGDA